MSLITLKNQIISQQRHIKHICSEDKTAQGIIFAGWLENNYRLLLKTVDNMLESEDMQ